MLAGPASRQLGLYDLTARSIAACLFRCRGGRSSPAWLSGVVPRPFISSYGAEADIVLAAILSAFIYYFVRDFAGPGSAPSAVRLGLLAGLGASTKYSGLAAPVSATIFFAIRIALGPHRLLAVRNAVIVVLLCLAVGGWKYVDNYRHYGTLFYANGSAQQGFTFEDSRGVSHQYEFTTILVRELMQVFGPHAVQEP
jgi:4-amino-4-deoxy-L-arabinose transferase-like glycosyltransferase